MPAASSSPLGEVRGEEQGEGDLGELARLEVDRPDADPQSGAVGCGESEAGYEREHEQHDPEECERPLVAGQVGDAPDDDQRGCVGADGHERPGRLQAREVRVDPGDHHVAEAVQERGQREERAVGAGGEHAGHQVRGDQQGEDDDEERRQVGGERGRAAEGGERACFRRDDRGEHDEPELGGTANLGDHGVGAGGGAGFVVDGLLSVVVLGSSTVVVATTARSSNANWSR